MGTDCATRTKTETADDVFPVSFPLFFFFNLICALCYSCWNKSFIYCIELGVAPLSSPACTWACRRRRPTPVAAPGTQGRPAWAGLRLPPLPCACRRPRGLEPRLSPCGRCHGLPAVRSSPTAPRASVSPGCPHRRPHLQPLCFLAAPTWKWPGSEPPRLVSKCPAFSCWSVCICSGSGQTLWPQPDGQGGARGSASLLFWGLLAFASLGSLLGLTVSFLGALVGLTCRSTSLPAALSPLLGAGLAWPPLWVSLLPPRVLRPQ